MEMPKKIFFVGIGGSGISAMARMMLVQGAEVSGSDIARSKIVDELEALGARITVGQSLDLIPSNTEVVVYTNSLKVYEPELYQKITETFSRAYSYPEFVGIVTENMETIAVSGTHGKTTTTAMVAKVLMDAGFDPSVIVGGIMRDAGTNFIAGKSNLLVLEADEYMRAFHAYHPKVLVITNIALDHLDYYRDLLDIQSAFAELARRVPEDGAIICDPKDANVAPILSGVNGKVIDYTRFEIENLDVPGEHNRMNARAALGVAEVLGVPLEGAQTALQKFKGTGRRFEYMGITKEGALVYDDYAHNPDKIRAAIQGAREKFPDKRLTVIFQPHTYSRTRELFSEFVTSFDNVDNVIVAPIFAGREHDDGATSHTALAEAIRNHRGEVYAARDFSEIKELVKKACGEKDLVLLVGAGDITHLASELVQS